MPPKTDRNRLPDPELKTQLLDVKLDVTTDSAVIRFANTWTHVVGVHPIERDVTAFQFDAAESNLRVLLIAKSGKFPASARLFVTYQGEPPVLDASRMMTVGALTAKRPMDDATFWQELQTASPGAADLLKPTPIKDEYEARRQATLSKPSSSPENFFYNLDRATYWPLLLELGNKADAKLIEQLGDYLMLRTLRRATQARYGLRFQGLRYDQKVSAHCKLVEPILHALMPQSGGTLDVEQLDQWFHQFVTGALLVPIGSTANIHGMPNTVNFFSFAEMIYLFRDLDLEWDFWRPALPTMLTACEVFCHLYWSGTERMAKSYLPCHKNPSVAFDYTRWRAMRNNIGSCSPATNPERSEQLVEELFGDIVAHALRDQTMYSSVGGVLVGGSLTSQMTLAARCSTYDGKYYTPTDAALAALWQKFQNCVAADPHCPESANPSEWNAAICKYLDDVIAQCLKPQSPFEIDKGCIFSRQSPDGWAYPDGAAHRLVFQSLAPVCTFGCERV